MFEIQTQESNGTWLTFSTAYTKAYAEEIVENITTQWENQTTIRIVEVGTRAILTEIADTLTRMGHTATIQSQSWRGMPDYLEIGETEAVLHDGQPYTAPRFTLYYNLNENGNDISGTGYHLSFEDDESQIVSEIGNESALRVVAEIIKGMARAEMQLENGFN